METIFVWIHFNWFWAVEASNLFGHFLEEPFVGHLKGLFIWVAGVNVNILLYRAVEFLFYKHKFHLMQGWYGNQLFPYISIEKERKLYHSAETV